MDRAEPEALVDMVHDKDWVVRVIVADKIALEHLHYLENDPDEEVRQTVKKRQESE